MKIGDKVRTNREMILSDDQVIPSGTEGIIKEIRSLYEDSCPTNVYYVYFEGFRNPVAPYPSIGCSSSELEPLVR